MTKFKVFSLLPALLLASIVHVWEAPEIWELSAAEIHPKHESLQPHKSLVAQLNPTIGIRALALSAIFLSFPATSTASTIASDRATGETSPPTAQKQPLPNSLAKAQQFLRPPARVITPLEVIRMAGEESADWREVARDGCILHGKLSEVSENYLKMDETLIFLLNMRYTRHLQVGSEVMLRIKEVSVDRKAIYAIMVPSEAASGF
ncbi:hypothetical protein [Parasutterella excrementihominis]|uniref:hypothetical protein n=1 Tax=Parasutterella excrementihominis TaxID=487175 RepID=UPI003AF1D041